VTREGERLIVTVRDRGPGFAPEVLDAFGKPYNSTKGRPGGGLGLFLVVNVARTLGGSVTAHNPPGGGAEVVLGLPLVALSLGDAPSRPAP
jgi:two-component system sensor histidine kinase RegB